MQKKIFTSLLMSPLALGAFANINVSELANTGWSTGSDTGGTVVQPDGTVLGSLGAGTITQTVKVPCPGTYQITFTSSKNVSFDVEGETLDITSETVGDDTTFTFEVAKEGDVTFIVKSVNSSLPFSFKSSNLQIVFDFNTAKSDLQADLNAALAVEAVDADVKTLATTEKDQNALGIIADLESQAAAINAEAAGAKGIQALITAIPAESATDAAKLANYKENEFYADLNKIKKQIEDLQDKTDELNGKIVNFNVNYPAFVDLNNGAAALSTALAAQNAKIAASAVLATDAAKSLDAADQKLATDYVAEACQGTADGIAEDITTYKGEIADQYSDLTAEVEFEPTKTAEELQGEITDLTADVTAAYKNVEDYAAVFGKDGLSDQLNAAYSESENTILDIKSVDEKEYPGVFSKKQSEWLKNIEDALAAANEVLAETKGNVGDATANLADNTAACDTAKTAFSTEADDATTFAADLNAEMNAALAALQTVKDNFKEYAQETAVAGLELDADKKAEYDAAVEKAKDAIEALESEIRSEYYANQFTDEDKNLLYQDLLDAANTANDEVKAITGPLDSQIKAQNKLQEFIDTLNSAPDNLGVDGNTVDLNKLFSNNLTALKEAVKSVDATTLQTVLDGIDENIGWANDLIDALTTAHKAYTDFSSSVNWLTTNILNNADANLLIDGKKYSGTTALDNAINAPVKVVNNKPDYTDAGYLAYDAKWKAQYLAAINAASANECDKLANELSTEITAYGWEAKVAASFNTYMQGFVDADFQIADDALQLIVASSATWADAANEKSPYSVAYKQYNTIKAGKADALDKTDKNQKLAACVELVGKLKALWGSVDIKGTINNMYQNVKDYNTFMGDIKDQIGDGTTITGSALETLQNWIKATYGPDAEKPSTALNTYLGWATAQETILKELKTKLNTQLEDYAVYSNKATTQSTIDGCTNRLKYPGGGIYTGILANEAAHDAVLVKAQQAKKTIIENLGKITSNNLAESLEGSKEFIDKLVTLRDTDLVAADTNTENAYVNTDAEKNCVANETALKAAYDKIIEEANSIYADFDEEWDTIVANNNNAFLQSTDWLNAKIQMNLTYVRAINAFNGYTSLNEHYTDLEAFKETVKSNAPLFDYNAEAEKLIADVEDYIASNNKNKVAISEADFLAYAITGFTQEDGTEHLGSDDIIAEMVAKAKNMAEDFNKVGEAYFNGGNVTVKVTNEDGTTVDKVFAIESLKNEAATKLQDMKNLLASSSYGYDADTIEEILEKVQEAFDAGVDAQEAADKVNMADFVLNARTEVNGVEVPPFYQTTIGYVMGAIADNFWSVLNANLNPQVVDKVWTPEYNKYVDGNKLKPENPDYIAGFKALETELNGYKANDKINVSSQETAFTNAMNAAATLDATVKAEKKDLLLTSDGNKPTTDKKSLLQTYEEQLKGYYEAAKKAVDQAKKANDDSDKETEFNNDRDAWNTAIEGLGNLVTLGGAAGQDYSDAENALDDFKSAITDFIADPTAENKADAIAAQSAAKTKVESAVNTAYTSESTYLENLIESLKVAYNDAYAADPVKVNDGKYLEAVDACIEKLEELKAAKYPAYKTDKFYSTAAALEKSISKNIVELNDISVPSEDKVVLTATLDKLNADVAAAKTAVTAGEATAVNPLVKDDLKDRVLSNGVGSDGKLDILAYNYSDLTQALVDLQTQYSELGANVIGQQGFYEAGIKAIEDKLATLNSAVRTAEVQAGYYDDLIENEWDEVDAEYGALKAYAESCGVAIENQFANALAGIESDLADVKADILSEYNKRTLTATTSFAYDLEPITTDINLQQLSVRKAFGTPRSQAAEAAINAVAAWVKTLADKNMHLIPGSDLDKKSLDEAINALTDELKTNNISLQEFNAGQENNDYAEGLEKINNILDKYEEIIEKADSLKEESLNETYQLGDLNQDGEVNVADLVIMRNLILDGQSYEELLKDETWKAYAANIVGDNSINIADYTALVNIVMNSLDADVSSASSMKKISRHSFYGVARSLEADGSISIEAVAEENGVRTYAISVSNSKAFVAGQLDLRVESTSRIVDVRGAERLDNHDVDFNSGSETTRVLITSLDNTEFEGTQGVTLYVDVEGYSGLGFENALFADMTAQTYSFANQAPVTTGVDSLYEGAKAVKEAVYDAAGRMMKKVQRGINIIRHSNGTVTKEMHK